MKHFAAKTEKEILAEGRSLYIKGDFSGANSRLLKLAKNGNGEACYWLGRSYLEEATKKMNANRLKEAKKYLEKGASLGNKEAAELLKKEFEAANHAVYHMQKCPILHKDPSRNEKLYVADACEENKNFITYRTVCTVPKKDVDAYLDAIARVKIETEIPKEEPIVEPVIEAVEEPQKAEKKASFWKAQKREPIAKGPWYWIMLIVLILRILMYIFEDLYFAF